MKSLIISGIVFILVFMKAGAFNYLFQSLFAASAIAGITFLGLEMWSVRNLKVVDEENAPDEIIIGDWESNDLNQFKKTPPHVAAAYARQKLREKK